MRRGWERARGVRRLATAAARADVPRRANLTLSQFEEGHLRTELPVILTEAIAHWPAVQLWSDLSYLRRKATEASPSGASDEEPVVVPVETGGNYLDSSMQHRHMSFLDYLTALEKSEGSEGSQNESGYLAQYRLFDALPTLSQDFEVPPFCKLGRGDFYGTHAWLGPKGTVSPLHKDPYHNCLAQVVGSKYIRIYHPRDRHRLYPYADFTRKNSSQVDAENPDLDSYPLFAEAPFLDCTLQAGELLYIPKGHWHYVRSLSQSFSVSFWWQ